MDWKESLDEQSEWDKEVDRGRMVWELLTRPSLEHAAEVWLTGGQTACRKLESVQMTVGRSLLGVSNTVARVAVLGDLGWRKLGERREKKIVYGRRYKA